jgi:hypothetical protein
LRRSTSDGLELGVALLEKSKRLLESVVLRLEVVEFFRELTHPVNLPLAALGLRVGGRVGTQTQVR